MRIETIKLWEDRDDVELTAFLNLNDPFLKIKRKRPAIISVPGGAYQTCPRHGNEGDPVAMSFAIDGYQAFVLEYSNATKAPEGKALFPAQTIDMAKAILTIKEHAKEWDIDPEQISIVGFSAGSHVCGMYATTYNTENKDLLTEKFGCTVDDLSIMSALCIYGLHDYELQEKFNEEHPNFMSDGKGNIPIFGSAHPDKATLDKYSPVVQATTAMPPMFLAHALDDGLVPAMHTIKMAERLQELGVPFECHLFQYGNHGFALGRNVFEPFKDSLEHDASDWLPLAKRFLQHQIDETTLVKEENPFKDMPF
ncbi:alpha/beta hydrolase [Pseudobutyrivibrio sp.]|uniref:alpha/beta hydrolase n=1 Tax=Pseudobutyrivibrio sp. TaxID=2014367 RepID=UPI001DCB1FE9|nr:alpha/beta hydrolase [Pseudobutyrivibrio sp.]MBE5910112.1 alpha/beta hydrolase [Pseudobutyrivibrio sp.]